MRLIFKSVDFEESRLPSIKWVGLVPSVGGHMKHGLPSAWVPGPCPPSALELQLLPGAPGHRPALQILASPSLHNHISQLLKINLSLSKYTSHWFCCSGEPQPIQVLLFNRYQGFKSQNELFLNNQNIALCKNRFVFQIKIQSRVCIQLPILPKYLLTLSTCNCLSVDRKEEKLCLQQRDSHTQMEPRRESKLLTCYEFTSYKKRHNFVELPLL